jgi:hypothetical protein
MAKKGTYWTPTVSALARAAEGRAVSAEMRNYIAGLIRDHQLMIHKAFAMGIPLAIGTDRVLPDPGYSDAYTRELGYFEQAGIARNDVIKIACESGARLLGL